MTAAGKMTVAVARYLAPPHCATDSTPATRYSCADRRYPSGPAPAPGRWHMLTRAENERLTRVGPGTPGGELLRRYWWPVAFSAELADRPVPVRLLGEDL